VSQGVEILATSQEGSCVKPKKKQPEGCPMDQFFAQDGNGSNRLTRSR
jgi:hypothetical protein